MNVLIRSQVHHVDKRAKEMTVCGSRYSKDDETTSIVDCRRCLGTMCGNAIDYLDVECRDEILRSIRIAFEQPGYEYNI